MSASELIAGLPGEALVKIGLADYAAGRQTIPACLVAIARPRMVQAGLIRGDVVAPSAETELELYRLLGKEAGDTYSRYNALLRELVSFECALDKKTRRQKSEDRPATSDL